MADNKTIMIVEDDMVISLVIDKMVRALGYTVVGKATSGPEAIEKVLELKPHIILMDIRIKGDMDGVDTVIKIREELDVNVIFLTGNSDKLNYNRAEKAGFVDLITKPFTMVDLEGALKKINE